MLKTVLLLLPMVFNTQAATVQTPVAVPEVQKYCVAIELPEDPRMPEYVESVNELKSDSSDTPTPIPYYARRSDRKNYRSDSDSRMNNNTSNNGSTVGNGDNNGMYNGNSNNGITNESITNDGKTNNDPLNYNGNRNNMTDKNGNGVSDKMNNNIVTIDDGATNYSSYNDAYGALKNKFDNMFKLQTSVDELRRELMSKETELMIHQELYQERLKSLVEKWNKD